MPDDRPKGDRAMRERGKRKVSFWLTEDEVRLVNRALRYDMGFVGSAARRVLLEWAQRHVALYEQQARGEPQIGGAPPA